MAGAIRGDDYQIVWLIRRLFRALGQKANENLHELGISAADRAVMEFLYPDEQLSVPEIARRYQVSRQHVQVTVNELLAAELLVTRDNPRHKRSPLLALSAKGQALFKTIAGRDAIAVTQLFSDISTDDKKRTRKTLEVLLSKLSTGEIDEQQVS